MAQSAHPAFPSLPPPASSSRQQLPPPTTSAELLQLLAHCTSLPAVRDLVIPLLEETPDAVLTLDKEDLHGLPDEEVQRLSAALIFVISARFNLYARVPVKYNDGLLEFAARLCNLSDPQQLYYCHAKVSSFANGMLSLAKRLQKVDLAAQALEALVQRTYRPNTFSGLYTVHLEACLLTRNYEAAYLILDQVFLDVRSASPNYLDVLTYYHHAGLIYAAVEEYGKAKQCFVTALSLPTRTTSAIQLAAAKRAYLCELLDTGKRLTLPKYTPSAVTRIIDRNAQIYVDLAKDYEAQHWAGVRKHADQRVFDQDCNRGLVDRVVTSITKWRILQLRRTYTRLTIEQLAMRVGFEPSNAQVVHGVLEEMVNDRSLEATITPSATGSSIVTFTQALTGSGRPAAMEKLLSASYTAALLQGELLDANRQAGLKKEYLRKQANTLEISTDRGGVWGARTDDFDQMMAAEDPFAGRPKRGVGANYNDAGF